MSTIPRVGDSLEHPQYGTGFVKSANLKSIEVGRFCGTERSIIITGTLLQRVVRIAPGRFSLMEKPAVAIPLRTAESNVKSANETPSEGVTASRTSLSSLVNAVKRDSLNAVSAVDLAKAKTSDGFCYLATAHFEINRRSLDFAENRKRSIIAISTRPFDVMLEVNVLTHSGSSQQLWYGHENVTENCVLGTSPTILAWTHPGLQVGLVADINEPEELPRSGFAILSVTPLRRARFTQSYPAITGMYEPGGSVGSQISAIQPRKTGLKAVKLNMSREQVRAFTSQMQGIMLITGAPGSGKTTIAYQRIRFLIDQQRETTALPVVYDALGTRILLANKNLLLLSRKMLEEELNLRSTSLALVSEFINGYLEGAWQHKWGSQSIKRKMSRWEERGRDAVFGLTNEEDLKAIWEIYEQQVRDRMKLKSKMTWSLITSDNARDLTVRLQDAMIELAGQIVPSNNGPKQSAIRINRVHTEVRKPYEALRGNCDDKTLKKFDAEFAKWLFYVYEPIETLHDFVSKYSYKTKTRIDRGIAGRGDADKFLEATLDDLHGHQYAASEHGMIAYLLRFVLPEEISEGKHFPNIPSAWPEGQAFTHLVIDEAQDLSAPESAFIASLVDPKGALTISADFRQRVSATHGIENAEPIILGCKISTQGMRKPFRFGVNKRQTPQIAKFLMAFYEVNFGETPPFEADGRTVQVSPAPLPELFIGSQQHFVQRLRQLKNVRDRSTFKESVAVLQVNENPEEKEKIEDYLRSVGVAPVSPSSNMDSSSNQWIVSNVEEIKGLEFDTCLVFGLDSVDAAELDYNLNRAYVALSRPAQRLVIFCHEFPRLLRTIPIDRYTKKDAFQ